jgi:hypothetical protein
MTWSEFTAAVAQLLTVDGVRLGTLDFVDRQLRAGLVDIQNFIPFYRMGHEETYGTNELTVEGMASRGDLPATADIQDCFLLRYSAAASTPITVTALATTATASASFFTESMVGKTILFASGERVTITEFTSETVVEFTPAFETGEEPAAAVFNVLTGYRSPFVEFDWEDRFALTSGQVTVADQYPKLAIDPRGSFYAYPAITGNDQIRLFWDGVKSAFEDEDEVPFDDQCAAVVADFVKGECARHFDGDTTLWASYNSIPNGSYCAGKRRLWREKRRRVGLKS